MSMPPGGEPVRLRGSFEQRCQMTDVPTRLYLKFEDGPEDTEYDEDPDDVGPAWIVRPGGALEELNGGKWIARAEAVRLAIENGYELDEDG